MIYVNSISDIKVGDKILVAKYDWHNTKPHSIDYCEVRKAGRTIIYLSFGRREIRLRLSKPKIGPGFLFIDSEDNYGMRWEFFRTKEEFEYETRLNEELGKLHSAARDMISRFSYIRGRWCHAEKIPEMADAAAALTAHILEFCNEKV